MRRAFAAARSTRRGRAAAKGAARGEPKPGGAEFGVVRHAVRINKTTANSN